MRGYDDLLTMVGEFFWVILTSHSLTGMEPKNY